jgi:hypothetical protein
MSITDENINEWCKKTFNFVKDENYLDRLLEVYPAELPPSRPLPHHIKNKIVGLYNAKNYTELVALLIGLKDHPFPIEHPYASLLRGLNEKDRSIIIRRNPVLVEKLGKLLISLGLNNIIKGVERPADINRILGNAFKSWIRREFIGKPFKVVEESTDLLRCDEKEICIYAGPDEEIGSFVKQYLDLDEPQEGFYNRDMVAYLRGMYIIAEARFLSSYGGSQTRDLGNTLRFVELMERISRDAEDRGVKVKGIVLLDGVTWFDKRYVKMIKEKAIGDRIVMSALFLKEYLLDTFNRGF